MVRPIAVAAKIIAARPGVIDGGDGPVPPQKGVSPVAACQARTAAACQCVIEPEEDAMGQLRERMDADLTLAGIAPTARRSSCPTPDSSEDARSPPRC